MCLAIPAQVSQLLDDQQQFAMVDVMGVRRRANIELLRDDPPQVGDWVLVHVGFAMSKVSAKYAEEQLELLNLLGEAAEPIIEPTAESTAEPAAESSRSETAADSMLREPRDEIR